MITLRGIAAPYMEIGQTGDRREFIAAGAFHHFLAKRPRVFLNFGSHDAAPICQSVTLFEHEAGLAFSASITSEQWDAIRCYVLTSHQHCSVNITDEKTRPYRLRDGSWATEILEAVIDHICVTDDRAVYAAGTGLWPAQVTGAMPPRLAALARSWDRGHREHKARQLLKQQLASVPDGARAESTARLLFTSRQAEFAAIRNALIRNRAANGLIFGSVAFSRVGGFSSR